MRKLGKTALLLAALMSAPAVLAVDVDAFIKKDKFTSIKVSPTGEYLAATVPMEDRTVLAVLRRSDNKIMTTFALGEDTEISGYVWANPTRLVISIAEQFGALDEPVPTGELYAVNFDGTNPEMLVGFRVQDGGPGTRIKAKKEEEVFAQLIDDLPADDKRVLISVEPFAPDAYARVEELDIYTGRRSPVASVPVRNSRFLTDNAGVVRFAWGAGFDLVNKLFYRAGEKDSWTLVNDESKSGIIQIPIGFSADNATAYLRAEQRAGADRIVSWDPATDTRRELLSAPVDPAGVLYASRSSVPVGAVYYDGRPTTRFFDPALPDAKTQRLLEAAFPQSRVDITSETADGRLALVHVSSDRNPGDYYLFDTVTKKADYLMSNRDWLDPEALHPMEPITFKARDGRSIHGYVTRPKGAQGRLPMVVVPHGGPFGIRDAWGFDSEAQMLASAGYVVLKVNFRGSGGYGREFEQAGGRQWGLAMQDDLTDATRWAIESGIADGSRVCLYGASYGAYASLMGVAKEPGLYRCAAGYVGVYELPALHTDGITRRSGTSKTYVREWIGERDELAAVSPTRMADRIKVPVFLAAGGEDQVAPIEHSKLMERALRSAGVPVETLYYDTEGHGFYKPERQREFYSRLLAFLSRSLGGKTASTPTASNATAGK
ncbi:alpha/beta hydrolase family protein [Lysobacter humi (ex Lee et al. 2017)]